MNGHACTLYRLITLSLPVAVHAYLNTYLFVCLFVWFLNDLVNYKVISRTGPETERLTILRAATHETALGDHDFCLSRSHYTDPKHLINLRGFYFSSYTFCLQTCTNDNKSIRGKHLGRVGYLSPSLLGLFLFLFFFAFLFKFESIFLS